MYYFATLERDFMATDKKEYIDTIEAITASATVNSIRNKLNKVRARTEDQRLTALLSAAIDLLDSSSIRVATTLRLTKPEFGKLHAYCNSVIHSMKPQWQILAERSGWVSGGDKP
jgi:hypothetical protein